VALYIFECIIYIMKQRGGKDQEEFEDPNILTGQELARFNKATTKFYGYDMVDALEKSVHLPELLRLEMPDPNKAGTFQKLLKLDTVDAALVHMHVKIRYHSNKRIMSGGNPPDAEDDLAAAAHRVAEQAFVTVFMDIPSDIINNHFRLTVSDAHIVRQVNSHLYKSIRVLPYLPQYDEVVRFQNLQHIITTMHTRIVSAAATRPDLYYDLLVKQNVTRKNLISVKLSYNTFEFTSYGDTNTCLIARSTGELTLTQGGIEVTHRPRNPTSFILDALYREIHRRNSAANDDRSDDVQRKTRLKTYNTYVNYNPLSYEFHLGTTADVPDHFQQIKESEDELLSFIHDVAGGHIVQQTAQAAPAHPPAPIGSTRPFQEHVYVSTSRCMVAMEISDPEAKKAAFRELFSEMVIHQRQTQGAEGGAISKTSLKNTGKTITYNNVTRNIFLSDSGKKERVKYKNQVLTLKEFAKQIARKK
jgi:hypothetical protein